MPSTSACSREDDLLFTPHGADSDGPSSPQVPYRPAGAGSSLTPQQARAQQEFIANVAVLAAVKQQEDQKRHDETQQQLRELTQKLTQLEQHVTGMKRISLSDILGGVDNSHRRSGSDAQEVPRSTVRVQLKPDFDEHAGANTDCGASSVSSKPVFYLL